MCHVWCAAKLVHEKSLKRERTVVYASAPRTPVSCIIRVFACLCTYTTTHTHSRWYQYMRGIKPLVMTAPSFVSLPAHHSTKVVRTVVNCTYVAPFTTARDKSLTADFFEENTWRNANHPSLYPHLHLHPYCWCGCCPRFLPTFLPRVKRWTLQYDQHGHLSIHTDFFTIYVPVVRILNIGWMTVNNISSGCFASPVIFLLYPRFSLSLYI